MCEGPGAGRKGGMWLEGSLCGDVTRDKASGVVTTLLLLQQCAGKLKGLQG